MGNLLDWKNLNLLVTGGTGSFGKKFIEIMMRDFKPNKIIVFSRDELKQHEMRMSGFDDPSLRFFIGDVRDISRLKRAMRKVDIVIHAAALKQVPSCEYNPFEAVKTNILGAQNIIDAAIDCGVKKVVALSTDKAVNPVNLYGATKLCSEKIFIQGNAYAGVQDTRFSCVRYGNVIGSRGSVIPLFVDQRKKGEVTITDERMTRFWISLEQAVEVVVKALCHMQGGEIFVPKIPSMKIVDLAEAIAPGCEIKIIGIRPGEKLHEILITEEDGRFTVDYDGLYVILPQFAWWRRQNYKDAGKLPEEFSYTSNNNDRWLTLNKLKIMAREFSTPFEQTEPRRLPQAGVYLAKSGAHKEKSRTTVPAKNIGFGNNIPT
jgi:UDP-N-acetylglucosamine 4,6-dehydratase